MGRIDDRMTAPLPKKNNAPERVRPTLVVGAGGTGSKVTSFAKAKMADLLGYEPHFAAYRVLDTDRKARRLSNLVDKVEFLDIGNFNAQAVVTDIYAGRQFASWQDWFPPHLSAQQVFLAPAESGRSDAFATSTTAWPSRRRSKPP